MDTPTSQEPDAVERTETEQKVSTIVKDKSTTVERSETEKVSTIVKDKSTMDTVLGFVSALGTALAVALVGVFGSMYLANRQETETNTRLYTELMSKREEADTSLRKEMFNLIITSFLKQEAKEDPAKEVLNLELLAYNFHDSLDLAPLFKDVSKKLEESRERFKKLNEKEQNTTLSQNLEQNKKLNENLEQNKQQLSENVKQNKKLNENLEQNKKQLSENLEQNKELNENLEQNEKKLSANLEQNKKLREICGPNKTWSEDCGRNEVLIKRLNRVARDVQVKQVAMLEEAGGKFDGRVVFEELFNNKNQTVIIDKSVSLEVRDPQGMITATIKQKIRILVFDANREKKELEVRFITWDSENREQGSAVFTVDPFDFPMIDNVRLPQGFRGAIVLNAFNEVFADFTFVYFPSSRASLKEKPYYDEILRNLRPRLKESRVLPSP